MRVCFALIFLSLHILQPVTAEMNQDRRRTIEFSGFLWSVKECSVPLGPGPNYFSASSRNVRLGSGGELHLNIVERRGRWYCSEVICEEPLGYGTYIFSVKGDINQLDPQAVLGIFTWDTTPVLANREIDIEFSRRGDPSRRENGQYVLQPFDEEKIHRFEFDLDTGYSTHVLKWTPDALDFFSYAGYITPDQFLAQENRGQALADTATADTVTLLASWKYSKAEDIPDPGDARVRINYYLYQGTSPFTGTPTGIIIERFLFIPERQNEH